MVKITFKPIDPKVDFPKMEEEILKWWYESGVVKKYLTRNNDSSKHFSFIDGPITANNPMGVHHAWGRTFKDLWQRYHTLKGEEGRYQNGFDCQGLWVEVEVEKELGIRNKRDIENLVPGDKKASIDKFVGLCKERVLKFSKIQTEQSKRLGYFMDWENSYFTMSDENNYMIWYFLKKCHENGWIYKGRDSVPWCPRCETAISQHEMLTEDYKELTHETVFVKLPITTRGWEKTYLLVWTTTPWTVPANVAVAVNIKYTYSLWKNSDTDEIVIILYKDENEQEPVRLQKGKEIAVPDYIFANTNIVWKKIREVSGKELVGLKYQAPFDQLDRVKEAQNENPKTFHTVVDGSEIVTAIEGTGLLHVAPGAGQEDFKLGKKEKLSIISVISDNADYLSDLGEFSGKNAKRHPEIIIDYLKQKENGKYLLKSMGFTHRYPACWRCKTELVWKVADEWYIAMDKPSKSQNPNSKSQKNETLRQRMVKVAKQIRWMPEFGLDRELDWLKNMHDWLISKPNRYWGLALPIYECKKCGAFEVIGGYEELKQKAVSGWEEFAGHTPHKPWIDEVKIKCAKCSEIVSRLPDVGNVWLDAGIVPYSTLVDPQTQKLSYTSDKKYWKKWFPADFITESFPGQFKNWFYSMIALSTVLENTTPFKTVLGFGTLLGEDGRPMHKSWGNAIEFNEGATKIGADVMRWMYAAHDPSQNMLFGYKKADETRRRFHLTLWNIYNFFITYASIDNWQPTQISNVYHPLDKWIISRLTNTTKTVTESLDKYDVFKAALTIEKFVEDLSLWYVRRSRGRVGPTVSETDDKNHCYATLWQVLVHLSQILSPFTPFLAEDMYKNLTGNESVHLSLWPKGNDKLIDKILEDKMMHVREIVELGHAFRKTHQLKVRQPLKKLFIKNAKHDVYELRDLLLEELNVKEIDINIGKEELSVSFDTVISQDLKEEGEVRELVRQIQQSRKEKKCAIDQVINLILPEKYKILPKELLSIIKTETLSKEISWGNNLSISSGR